MCYICHKQFLDENIEKQFTDALEKKEFHKWNLTSINHITLAIQNNSEKCKKLGIKLLEEYIEYCNKNKTII
jgi:hypothetical protein